MKRTRTIAALFFNALILGSEGFALPYAFLLHSPGVLDSPASLQYFSHYTIDSNYLLMLAALISLVTGIVSLIKKKPAPIWTLLVKFVATVSVTTTLFVVLFGLFPVAGSSVFFELDLLFLHLIDPILALVVFVFFEGTPDIKKRLSFLGLIPLVIYGGVLVPICTLTGFEDPYAQIKFLNLFADAPMNIAWKWAAIVFGTWLIGFLFLWARTKIAKISADLEAKSTESNQKDASVGQGACVEEQSPQAAPTPQPTDGDVVVIQDEEDTEESEEAEEIRQEEEDKKANPTSYMNRPRVYHIAKHGSSGRWQVRLATGQKAIKLFDTQEQAINYAKSLVKTQGGSVRVHSLKGKMRKH